jgi:hypothetical protein
MRFVLQNDNLKLFLRNSLIGLLLATVTSSIYLLSGYEGNGSFLDYILTNITNVFFVVFLYYLIIRTAFVFTLCISILSYFYSGKKQLRLLLQEILGSILLVIPLSFLFSISLILLRMIIGAFILFP